MAVRGDENMNTLITIAYDGSRYCGWQKQKEKEMISVQQRVEEGLSALLKKEVEIRGASRTDAGVHALGQAALIKENFTVPLNKLPYAVNSFLPDDIVVTDAVAVSDSFHPQGSVLKKTYEYKIFNAKFPNPMMRKYSEFVYKQLDIEKMSEAAKYFIGTFDFKAFCAAGGYAKTTVRTIYNLNVKKENDIISVNVTGNGFLYNMVRIIVGTLIYVGENKIMPQDIGDIIKSKNRANAGKTVSPNGLTLMKIYYKL